MADIILLPYLPRTKIIYVPKWALSFVIQFLDEDSYEEEVEERRKKRIVQKWFGWIARRKKRGRSSGVDGEDDGGDGNGDYDDEVDNDDGDGDGD